MRVVPKLCRPDYKNAERRYDRYGEMRLMTEADGYVMMRRKGAMPFVVSRDEWDRYSRTPLKPQH
jgi:hypothetical protein